MMVNGVREKILRIQFNSAAAQNRMIFYVQGPIGSPTGPIGSMRNVFMQVIFFF